VYVVLSASFELIEQDKFEIIMQKMRLCIETTWQYWTINRC